MTSASILASVGDTRKLSSHLFMTVAIRLQPKTHSPDSGEEIPTYERLGGITEAADGERETLMWGQVNLQCL